MQMLNSSQFDALAQESVIKTIEIQGTAGGFVIEVNGKLLEAKRGHTRVFKKLHTAAAFLKGHGIGAFKVDISKWQPDQKSAL